MKSTTILFLLLFMLPTAYCYDFIQAGRIAEWGNILPGQTFTVTNGQIAIVGLDDGNTGYIHYDKFPNMQGFSFLRNWEEGTEYLTCNQQGHCGGGQRVWRSEYPLVRVSDDIEFFLGGEQFKIILVAYQYIVVTRL